MATQLRTITVARLLDLLRDEDPEARVIFTADYGDHARTAQALPIRGEVEEVLIERSAYSASGYALADDDEHDDEHDATFLVIR